MDHHMQQFGDFRLELMGFRYRRLVGHRGRSLEGIQLLIISALYSARWGRRKAAERARTWDCACA